MATHIALLALVAALVPTACGEVPQMKGWKTTWSDDFEGVAGTQPDVAKWIFTTGTSYPGGAPMWGTWEIQTYTNRAENIRLNGQGQVEITAIRDGAGLWTSARIETVDTSFQAPEGGRMRIEGRISLPALSAEQGIGYWPAFWSLGKTFRGNFTNWPQCGELDIMENVNAVNKIWGTMHCDTYFTGECNETTGRGGNTLPSPEWPVQGNYHTYTMEINRASKPEAVIWYHNGYEYWRVTEDQLSERVWKETVHIPYFLLVNMAIGGQFPDKERQIKTPLESTANTGTMKVDYIAVYHRGPGKKHEVGDEPV